MIDMVKNRKKLEQEKKKFWGENFDDNFEKLLEEKEDDPEFRNYIEEYRETEAWIIRYDIKEQNTGPQEMTDEEAKIALGKSLHNTEAKTRKLIDLEKKIMDTYYKQILKSET